MRHMLILIIVAVLTASGANAFTCPNPKNPGTQVPYIYSPQLNNIGYARINAAGQPEILWNPNFGGFSSFMRQFFKYHECAHVQDYFINGAKLKKIYQPLVESRTDCLALMMMKKDGLLSKQNFHHILASLKHLPQTGSHTHFSGKKRALIIIDDCMYQNNLTQGW